MEVDLEVVMEAVQVDTVEAMEDIELVIRCIDSSYLWVSNCIETFLWPYNNMIWGWVGKELPVENGIWLRVFWWVPINRWFANAKKPYESCSRIPATKILNVMIWMRFKWVVQD
jgi:hypothetical protein